MSEIQNYGAALPKQYKADSFGENKELGIKKLFRGIILSPSGGGKTTLVFHIIKHSPNIYSHLHIIAKNPDQPLYNFIKDKLGDFCTIYDPDEKPPSVDDIQKDKNNGLQLVVIDDYSNDKKLQHDVFSTFFIRGRHKNLSTLFLSHSYFAIDKLIRLNSEYIFILKANSMRDLKLILSDYMIPNITLEQLVKAYEQATSSKGQSLFINLLDSSLHYNFSKKNIMFNINNVSSSNIES